jgi:hypothetical protein
MINTVGLGQPQGLAPNGTKLSRSLSGVEAILPTSAPLSQRFILPRGT